MNCPHFVARRGGEDPASVVIPPLFEVWQGAQEAGGGVPGWEEGEGAGALTGTRDRVGTSPPMLGRVGCLL